jgi:ATP-dependent Lon protease
VIVQACAGLHHAHELRGHREQIAASAAETSTGGRLYVEVEEQPDETPPPIKTRELETEYRAVVEEILELREADARIGEFLRSITEPGALADTCAYSPDLTFAQRVELLETLDVMGGSTAVRLQRERLAELQVRRRIRDDVETGAGQQREYFLRKQLESIRKELGEDEASVADGTGRRSKNRACPTRCASRRARARRLERMGFLGRGVDDPHLPGLAPGVPWSTTSDERLDRRSPARFSTPTTPATGREGADRRAPGRAQAAPGQESRRTSAPGDPHPDRPSGTGKTSIGESIARALNRVRADVARRRPRQGRDPRPPAHLHRRTARPARPRPARRRDDNPVIMLDEVDKVGADWRGDPSAALLEVLDPAQNHSFRDHYLDVELDLSRSSSSRPQRCGDDPGLSTEWR